MKCPSLLIFACIKECQKTRSPYNWIIGSPSTLLFDPGKIERDTLFSSRILRILTNYNLNCKSDPTFHVGLDKKWCAACGDKSDKGAAEIKWRRASNESLISMYRANSIRSGEGACLLINFYLKTLHITFFAARPSEMPHGQRTGMIKIKEEMLPNAWIEAT